MDTGRSSTVMPKYSFAMCIKEYLVMLGRIEGDFGVTNTPPFVMPKKFDVPTSSM